MTPQIQALIDALHAHCRDNGHAWEASPIHRNTDYCQACGETRRSLPKENAK